MLFVYKSARDYLKTSWIWLAFALAAIVFTFGPHQWGFLDNFDLGLAHAFNGLIGHSSGYDKLLEIINKDEMQWWLAGIIFIIYLVFAWRERYWDMGRLLGYLLWISAGVVLAMFLAYSVADRLEAELEVHGPKAEMGQSFRNINEFNDGFDVDLRDSHSVPSRYTVVLFSVFFLTFFRSRKLSYALLVPAVIFSPAGMLVGREWPSSVVAGVLWAGAVAAFLTRTPLAVVPRWLEENSVFWVERVLTLWTPSLPESPPDEPLAIERAKGPTGPLVTVRDLPKVKRDHLADLVEKHILPLMNCEPGSEVLISAVAPDADRAEPSRWMRFVTGGGLERGLVVKAAWKNPLNATQARRFLQRRNAANMHALLQLRGISVPRLLFTQNTRRVFAPRRFFFTVEDLLHERALQPGNAADCVAATRQLREMHAIRRIEAGGVFGLQIPAERYPHRLLLPRIREQYTTILREMPVAELSFFGRHTLTWFWERSAALLQSGEMFSLCHGNPVSGNTRFTANGPVILSFTKTAFDLPGFDIIRALHNWSGGNADAATAILQSYFADASEQEWTRFREGFEIYLARTLFEMLDEHLTQPESRRDENWSRRMAGNAAKVLQGAVEKPSSPAEAAVTAGRYLFL